MSDARERWKEKHRKRRIRARWLDPLKIWTGRALFVVAAGCLVLAGVAHIAWFLGFFPAMLAGLRLHGITLGQIFSAGGFDSYTDAGGGDGGGDGGGGS